MTSSNYDQWRTDWQTRFLSMDPHVLCRKLPFLSISEERLTLPYFNQTVFIRLSDGVIEPPPVWGKLSLMDEMNIYTMLWYSRPGAALTGCWCAFENLRDARPFGPAFRKGNLSPFAQTFSGHADLLASALQSFGGKPLPTGDVGYEIEVFSCIPMQVLFWEGDEEFPAQCNLLFDSSAPDFIHIESVVSIASEALKHLAHAAGLPILGPLYDTPESNF